MSVNNIVIIFSAVLLSGCFETIPTVKIVTQKVDIPIATPCKTETPTKPVFSFDKLTTENNIYEKAQAALADINLQKAYQLELEAALKSCK